MTGSKPDSTDGLNVNKTAVDYDPFAGESLDLVIPSTEAQREIWSSIQMDENASCAFNESITLELTGELDFSALETAIDQLVQRHQSLRVTFSADGKNLLLSDEKQILLRRESTGLENAIASEAELKFDLENGPLVRFTLVAQSNTSNALILTAHHIICDGWSLAILVSDLGELYSSAKNKTSSTLADTFGFSDYVEDQAELASDDAYWVDKFKQQIPQYDLPVDFPRGQHRSFNAKRIDFDIDLALFNDIKTASGSLGCSLTAYMLAAYYVCLNRWTNEDYLAIGIPTAGQPLVSPEALVGHCVNMLPITVSVDAQSSFRGFVDLVAADIFDAFEHRNTTYGSLVNKLKIKRDPSRIPLLSVLFNVDQGIQGSDLNYDGLGVVFRSNPRHFENFEMFINASDYGDRFTIECQYNTDLFTEESILNRLQEYSFVMQQLASNADTKLADLLLLTNAEQNQLVLKGQGPQAQWESSNHLPGLLCQQVAQRSAEVAVTCANESLTYQQLDQQSNQLAHYLIAQSVKPTMLVGLCMTRSNEMLVALLAILKTGAAYVPLDPNFPSDRLAYMVDDSGLQHLLCNSQHQAILPSVAFTCCLDQVTETLAQQPVAELTHQPKNDDPAYVIYTSGSTGRPKGVVVPQGAVVNFLNSMAQTPGINADDKLLAVTTLSFDIAVLELYLPLVVGAQVVIASKEDASDGRRLLAQLNDHQITVMQATPATWRLLLSTGWQGEPKIKALCGGEALPKDLAAELLPYCVSLWNLYGPTETTVWSTCGQVTEADTHSNLPLNIGQPIGNTQLYVLDEQLNVVPQGVAGELLIGGDGVTLGYHNRDDLTQAQFIDCPAQLPPGRGKLYRTGDKVRYRHDGQMEYLGRLDQQVKVRGFRIELGEIETLMRQHPAIEDCAVTVKEERAGDVRLVAYVVWQQNSLTLTEVRNHLKAQLPPYMIPQHVETMTELPRTLNGKLDRKSLASRSINLASGDDTTRIVEAKNSTEQTLLTIWRDVLNTRNLGTEDDFFDLGGHSLLIAKVIQHVEVQLDIRLKFKDLYSAPTISELAALITNQADKQSPSKNRIVANTGHSPSHLSLAQQRLWYLSKLSESSTLYNLPSAFRFMGELNVEALNQSFADIVERHQVLKSRIIEVNDEPFQALEHDYEHRLEEIDLSAIDNEHRQSELSKQLVELQSHQFDILEFPLFKTKLFKLNQEEHVLFFMPHHAVFDGWSFDIFIHELTQGYAKHCSQPSAALAELPIQYSDYAMWMRQWLQGNELDEQLDYWKGILKGSLPILDLPLDYPRPEIESHIGAQVEFQLEQGLVDKLAQLALNRDSSLFMVMMSAYLVMLNRYTGQEDIIVGAPMADRSRPGTENLIGFFVNALVMRFDVKKDDSFLTLLEQVKDHCLNAFSNQDAPFEKLVEVVSKRRDLSRSPLFQTSLTYQDISNREVSLGDLEIQQVEVPSHDSPLDLNLWLKRRGSSMEGAVVYSTGLFQHETIRQFVDQYLKILTDIVNNSHQPVGQLSLLTDAEQNQLVRKGQGEQSQWETSNHLPGLLCQQVAQRSTEVAVTCAEASLTYQQLDQRSNQLAHYLMAQGVKPTMLVGLCMTRSNEMLVALLAILKTGAAYVPLDPNFPSDRLAYMVEDSGLQHLLCDSQHQANLPQVAFTCCLDQVTQALAQQSVEALTLQPNSQDPAYVIYTSGSTGRPKGVVVPQGAVVNFLNSMAQTPGIKADDKLLAVTTLSFDIAVLELYLPLVVGAQVVIASKEDASDGRRLLAQLQDHQITVMQATPATWRLLLSTGWQGNPKIKALCGGEALPKDLAAELLPHCLSLWNLYGPTETTVWSTCGQVTAADTNSNLPLNIGQPIGNTQLYVLDEQLNVVPQGVAGELLIGGDGVTLGYHNRDDLTQAQFIDCPAQLPPGRGKLYRTGDKVRYRHDGQMEYLGRLDQQVKVRGFRIELGEIETLMRQHPAIEDCAVTVKEERAGDVRLVAYVVWQQNSLTLTEVRNHLKTQLPPYMIPQHVETMTELPRTLNGKLDRKSLAQKTVTNDVRRTSVAPNKELEIWLAAIWADVLNAPTVAKFDNFFDLGGHSLLSMQVIHKVKDQRGLELAPRQLLLDNLSEICESLESQIKVEFPNTNSESISVDKPIEAEKNSGRGIKGFVGKLLRKSKDRT